MKPTVFTQTLVLCSIFLIFSGGKINAAPAEFSFPGNLVSPDTILPPCNLPAPKNFHLIGQSSVGQVSLGWEELQDADAYLLEVFLQGTLGLDSFHLIIDTPGITLTIPAGNIPSFKVRGICIGGLLSGNYSYIPPVGTILLDLVLEAHTPQTYSQLDPSTCYPVLYQPGGEEYWFDVVAGPNGQGTYSRYSLYSYYDPQSPGNHERMRAAQLKTFRPGFYTEPLGWATNNGQSGYNAPPVIPAENVLIRTISDGGYLDLFRVTYSGTSAGQVCFTPLAGSGYSIKFYKGQPALRPKKVDDRAAAPESSEIADEFQVINPFVDELRLVLPQGATGPVSVQLFALDGRLEFEQKFPARQEYNLPTSDLTPGLYFLRINTGGQTRTYKVVKAH